MSMDEERQRALIADQAAAWLTENREAPDPARHLDFVAWLRASPVHAQAYSDALRIASQLRQALPPAPAVEALAAQGRSTDESNVRQLEPRPPAPVSPRARRIWLYAIAAAVVPAAALLFIGTKLLTLNHSRPEPPVAALPTEHFVTGHGQQLSQQLSDGSVLRLNTDTAVTVHLLAASRQVELEHGQAIFEVAHDAARPFQVTAGSARVTAVGTQFDVYLQSDATVVTVLEGKVAVTPAVAAAHPAVLVGAGEQVRVVRGEIPAEPTAVDPSRSTAWLHRQISFRHEPLSQVIEEFNRYATTPIRIDSPAIGNLPVSGVFNVDDTESMVAFLRSLHGVKVEVTSTSIQVSGD
jgi:transmembrane sensor